QALHEEERGQREGWAYTGYVNQGLYHRQLSAYLECFPARQIRVFLFEDLLRDPAGVLRELCGFLEVDPALAPISTPPHGATGIVRNPLLREVWRNSGRVRRLLRPVIPPALRGRLFAWITRDQIRPSLDPAIRARLLRVFRSDILALQDLIGRDLSHWLD